MSQINSSSLQLLLSFITARENKTKLDSLFKNSHLESCFLKASAAVARCRAGSIPNWQQNMVASSSSTWYWFCRHEDGRLRRSSSLVSQFQGVAAAKRYVVGSKGLQRGPAKPQHETMKFKSRLQWKPQDDEDTRTMGHLPNKSSSIKWRWPKIEIVGSVRAGCEWGYPSPLESR